MCPKRRRQLKLRLDRMCLPILQQADALSELAVAVAEVAVFGHDLHESLHTAPSLRSKEGS